jgi:hypothetical protein
MTLARLRERSYLEEFSIDAPKIDQSLVGEITSCSLSMPVELELFGSPVKSPAMIPGRQKSSN